MNFFAVSDSFTIIYLADLPAARNALRLLTRTFPPAGGSSALCFASKKEGKNFDFS
jgi:hypothetical protein